MGREEAMTMMTATKSGLGEAGVMVDVAQEVLHGVILRADEEEGDDPEAEDDFDFAEEVADGRAQRDGHALLGVKDAEALGAQLGFVALLQAVSHALEEGREEGMDDGAEEMRVAARLKGSTATRWQSFCQRPMPSSAWE